jgi:hypothetical protein
MTSEVGKRMMAIRGWDKGWKVNWNSKFSIEEERHTDVALIGGFAKFDDVNQLACIA